ncbi:MAG: hypothetical protein WBC44_09425 [Planctomycetaceae bacterium]
MELLAPLSHQAFLVAQASADGIGSVAAIVTALTGSGFAVWYAWYMTTTQIPRINAEHRDAVAQLVAEFRMEQKETRELFQHSLAMIERDGERNAMAIDRLCDKLGHPGPLSVKADSVVIKGRDSDPSVNVTRG